MRSWGSGWKDLRATSDSIFFPEIDCFPVGHSEENAAQQWQSEPAMFTDNGNYIVYSPLDFAFVRCLLLFLLCKRIKEHVYYTLHTHARESKHRTGWLLDNGITQEKRTKVSTFWESVMLYSLPKAVSAWRGIYGYTWKWLCIIFLLIMKISALDPEIQYHDPVYLVKGLANLWYSEMKSKISSKVQTWRKIFSSVALNPDLPLDFK